MISRISLYLVTALVVFIFTTVSAQGMGKSPSWQEAFDIESCNLLTTGKNPYFILEPGFQLILEGDDTKLQITILDETKTVDGIVTRILEEKEWIDGQLYEISRNYFAMCEQTKDIFYFGEDVDFYEGEKVVKHDGSWLAGVNDNKAGLIMPGTPKVGMRYYQEIAPEVAMDRGEIVSIDETCETPAGTFSKCLKVKEGSAIKLLETEYKYYAPDIGMVADEDLRLIKHGFITDK